MSKFNSTATGCQVIGDTTADTEIQSSGTSKFIFKSDGRFYGTSLHNNANPVTGTTNQYIASGTYTPSQLSASNCGLGPFYPCSWIRVGNVVTVSGTVGLIVYTVGAAANMSLPIPTASTNGGGVMASIQQNWQYSLRLNSGGAYIDISTASASGLDYAFTFTYLIS